MSRQQDETNQVIPAENRHLALARKMILLGLIMITLSMGLVLFFIQITIEFPLFAVLFADGVIGLLSGFSIRKLLVHRTVMLRVVMVFIFTLASLVFLGWFTGWSYGIGPVRWGSSEVGWLDLAQWLGAAGVSFLALVAWKRERHSQEPVTTPIPARQEQIDAPHSTQQAGNGQGSTRTKKTQKKQFQSRRTRKNKVPIKLSREEEHRCPYCLEVIDPDDPRGTVECRICHTLHHVDCWAITGVCQVPHSASRK